MDNAPVKNNLIKENKTVDTELKKAVKVAKEPKPKKERKGPAVNFKFGIISLVIGALALVAGIVFLVINLVMEPATRDADFIVSTGSWQREDAPSVIWTFTEIGKGKLTTNNHVNDYDFIWAIDKDELKIETAWLYELNNSYTYKLDQEEKLLTLTSGEGENLVNINFRPASSVDPEVTEDN